MAVGVEGARCGFLVVPETRGGTRGRTLRLAVARLPATGPNPAPDPVLFLHGGPGGSALSSARLHAGHPLRARREYILLDQRGVGASQPVLCPELGKRELAILAEDHAPGADEAPRLEAWLACRDELLAQGVDLGAYHSDASADDVADLRLALGIEQWNFFAISYGTKLALQILRRHPEGVRSAVLDSVYPPGVPAFESRTVDFARALDVLARRCREDAACAEAWPDLERRGWEALAALEAQPLRVPVRPSEVLPASEFVVNPQDAAVTLHQLLYLRDAFPALPYLIDVLARRDAAAMTNLIEAMGPRAVAVNRAVNNTVECYERAPFASFEGYRRRSAGHPELLRWFTYFDVEFEACARWAEAKAPASENELVPRDVPLLVLAGEWDPITPPAWGRLVAERFPRATFQEFPGVGHGADRSHPCPRSAVVAFYDDPSRPPDLSCAASMAQPRFVTAVRRSPGVYRVAADVFGKPRRGLVAGLAVLALVLAVAGVGLLAAAIRGGGSTASRVGRLAAALGSLLALGFLGGVALAVARTAESSALLLAFGLESKWSPLFALPWLAGAAGLVAVLAAPAALRESGRAGRVLFDLALVAIAAFLVLWRGFRF